MSQTTGTRGFYRFQTGSVFNNRQLNVNVLCYISGLTVVPTGNSSVRPDASQTSPTCRVCPVPETALHCIRTVHASYQEAGFFQIDAVGKESSDAPDSPVDESVGSCLRSSDSPSELCGSPEFRWEESFGYCFDALQSYLNHITIRTADIEMRHNLQQFLHPPEYRFGRYTYRLTFPICCDTLSILGMNISAELVRANFMTSK